MANKTQIVNATINPKTRCCYVTYSTGTEKIYPAYKLPKTVQAWLDKEKETAEAVELEETTETVDPETTEETICSETTEEATEETTEEITEDSSSPIDETGSDESFGNPGSLPENDKSTQTQNKAHTATLKDGSVKLSKEDLKRFSEALRATGKKIAVRVYKAACVGIPKAGLIIAAFTLALADLVKFLLPILADIAIAGAGWTFGFLSDTLPGWAGETVKPKAIQTGKAAIHAGKEVIKSAVILSYMARIALS